MQENSRIPVDHGRSSAADPRDASGPVHHFERARPDAFSDRSRVRACILAFIMIMAASPAPGILASGDEGSALVWSGLLTVLALLLSATLLTMRRRSQARQRGVRLLGPAEPEGGPASPATGG